MYHITATPPNLQPIPPTDFSIGGIGFSMPPTEISIPPTENSIPPTVRTGPRRAFSGRFFDFSVKKAAENLLGIEKCVLLHPHSGCSSVRLEYASGGRVVAGSNPVIPTVHFTGQPVDLFQQADFLFPHPSRPGGGMKNRTFPFAFFLPYTTFASQRNAHAQRAPTDL